MSDVTICEYRNCVYNTEGECSNNKVDETRDGCEFKERL